MFQLEQNRHGPSTFTSTWVRELYMVYSNEYEHEPLYVVELKYEYMIMQL